MKFCRRCLYPETKPNLWFDDTGLCSACIAFDARAKIDWIARAQEFVDKFPHGTRVVVACSGGKDSTFIVVTLKQLGLHPLAVCATTDHLSAIGRRNLDNIGRLCDLIEVTPDKTLRRKMSKYALETVGDISWCEHVLIWTVPAKIAHALDIPHVFYGENPQNEYGAGPRESQRIAGMPPQWEQEFGGMLGLRVSDMQEQFPDGDFDLYRMPLLEMPCHMPTRHFLGYYFPWEGYQNALVARQHGFEWVPHWVEGSACAYENLDNLQTGIHDYFKYIKFGFGRATDIVSNSVRRGMMSRADAIEIIDRFDGAFPHTYLGVPLAAILDKIGMTEDAFLECVQRYTNRTLFQISGFSGKPSPKFEVT